MFAFPARLDHAVVSDLENHIIDICRTAGDYESIRTASAPVWDWAVKILHKNEAELRHLIESHEADEHFPNQFLEEKDHLLKLPLVLLEKINN